MRSMARIAAAALVGIIAGMSFGCANPAVSTVEPVQEQERRFMVTLVNDCDRELAVHVAYDEPAEGTHVHMLPADASQIRPMRPEQRLWRREHNEWEAAAFFADAPQDGQGWIVLRCG